MKRRLTVGTPPADLLARFQDGALLAVPPNVSMFRALAKDMAQKDLGDVNLKYDPETQVPCMEIFGNLWQMLVRSHTLPPAKFTNAFVIGGWLVDPSPESESEMEKLLNSLERFSLKGIFLTHHHADHHQFCPQIARRLKLPVCSSQDSYQRITRIRPDYFAGIETRTAGDGDVLTRWNHQDVKVHGVPGHDEGQLGLAPQSMAWFLVGDLIQGVGTVVISAPEGHMGRYFQSLERVIQNGSGHHHALSRSGHGHYLPVAGNPQTPQETGSPNFGFAETGTGRSGHVTANLCGSGRALVSLCNGQYSKPFAKASGRNGWLRKPISIVSVVPWVPPSSPRNSFASLQKQRFILFHKSFAISPPLPDPCVPTPFQWNLFNLSQSR